MKMLHHLLVTALVIAKLTLPTSAEGLFNLLKVSKIARYFSSLATSGVIWQTYSPNLNSDTEIGCKLLNAINGRKTQFSLPTQPFSSTTSLMGANTYQPFNEPESTPSPHTEKEKPFLPKFKYKGMVSAVEIGDLNKLKEIFNTYDCSLVIDKVDDDDKYFYRTLLQHAIQNDYFDVMKFLVEKGADINASNTYGETALMYACRYGTFEMVQYLINHGADVNIKNDCRWAALKYVFYTKNLNVMKLLIENKIDLTSRNIVEETYLMDACKDGTLDMIKLLLDLGADIHATSTLGENALMMASSYGNVDAVRLLHRKGADIHTKDTHGNTALIKACHNNQIDVVTYLLQLGANVNEMNKSRDTPLILATKNNNPIIVRYLLSNGAERKYKDNKGRTALRIAKEKWYYDVANILQFYDPTTK